MLDVLKCLNGWQTIDGVLIDRRNGYALSGHQPRPEIYNDAYFEKYERYSTTELGHNLTKFRADLCRKYYATVIDIGIGNGQFLDTYSGAMLGYDVCPRAIGYLKDTGRWCDIYSSPFPRFIDGVTLWDTLEHIPDPTTFLHLLPRRCTVFVSIPIVRDWSTLTRWKHYRPGEHIHYWSRWGFIRYFRKLGFRLLERSDEETRLGREDIQTFVFGI